VDGVLLSNPTMTSCGKGSGLWAMFHPITAPRLRYLDVSKSERRAQTEILAALSTVGIVLEVLSALPSRTPSDFFCRKATAALSSSPASTKMSA